ncbi:MAG: hypothetical protein KGL53_13715 [Elusimicrobia bacterium]|nr:hypothetical protein [Elusimicrobiota bacterium]
MSLLLAALLLAGAARPAHAYLDPSGGSMIFQILAAGFAGIAVAVRVYWKRLKDRLHRRQTSTKETSGDNSRP